MLKTDLYEQINSRIISEIERNGVLPWRRNFFSGPPANYVSGRHYQGINFIALAAENVPTPYFLTFLQAREKNLKIKTGSKGRMIVFWKVNRIHSEEDETESGKQVPFIRYSYVFNLSDMAEYEIPQPKLEKPNELIAGVNSNHLISYVHNIKGSCSYNPVSDTISSPTVEMFTSEEEYFSSLFHELIHWTGHSSRLNRLTNNDMKSPEYAFEELVAELGSTYLAALCGIKNCFDNSVSYINGWINSAKLDTTYIIRASQQSQRAVQYLLKTENQII